MCSTFSPAATPCISVSNGKFPSRKSTVTRAEVTVAPQNRSTCTFPALLKHGAISLADLHVQQIVERQSQNNKSGRGRGREDPRKMPQFQPMFLEEAYESCRNICAEYVKTFYLGPPSFPFFHQFDKFIQYIYQVLNSNLLEFISSNIISNDSMILLLLSY